MRNKHTYNYSDMRTVVNIILYDCTHTHTHTHTAKVRRLYDIANVLTTLNLIRKKTFLAPNHRKMPGYYWCGPSLEQIDVLREFNNMQYQKYYSC